MSDDLTPQQRYDRLTVEQQEAIAAYVQAMQAMGDATQALIDVGLDAGTALACIPGETEGSSALDSLPPMMRMLIA